MALAMGLAPGDLKLITALLVMAALALPSVAGEPGRHPRRGVVQRLAQALPRAGAAGRPQPGVMAGQERR
ncbi:MAG: hypothetical protein IMX02_01020 [Limnochordaceae bacterium]|nr:hypothetical protein [Limnochordaceae bacterium]